MFVAENFLYGIVDKPGHQYPVSTADGGTWYPQACHFLKLKHRIHPFVYKDEKSIIELTMQYIKKIDCRMF
jgi:putative transposase